MLRYCDADLLPPNKAYLRTKAELILLWWFFLLTGCWYFIVSFHRFKRLTFFGGCGCPANWLFVPCINSWTVSSCLQALISRLPDGSQAGKTIAVQSKNHSIYHVSSWRRTTAIRNDLALEAFVDVTSRFGPEQRGAIAHRFLQPFDV